MSDESCNTPPAPAPPLPGRCGLTAPSPVLRTGCYLVEFTDVSDPAAVLDGTLRVEATPDGVIASGDLYERPRPEGSRPPADPRAGQQPVTGPAPDPSAGIPIFPIDAYRCYLRITGVEESDVGVTLALEEHRAQTPGIDYLDHSRRWFAGSTFILPLTPDGEVLAGPLLEADGRQRWQVMARWVSPFLRRATLEIDRVALSEAPLSSGTAATWQSVFEEVGWDLTVVPSHVDVTEPSGPSWSGTEAHAMMLALRDSSDLDAEWRYHGLAVRRFDMSLSPFGWTYDTVSGPMREGFMVATHWVLPEEAKWGLAQGKRFGTVPAAFFRSAAHELGHAMGLSHNTGNTIMNTTENIAELSLTTPGTPFPDNIDLSYAVDDQHRLRHWPDPVVRPGTSFRSGDSAPLS